MLFYFASLEIYYFPPLTIYFSLGFCNRFIILKTTFIESLNSLCTATVFRTLFRPFFGVSTAFLYSLPSSSKQYTQSFSLFIIPCVYTSLCGFLHFKKYFFIITNFLRLKRLNGYFFHRTIASGCGIEASLVREELLPAFILPPFKIVET